MIELRGVTKRFGPTVAVDDVSLVVPEGELTILLGPSGCGKTTLLRVINRMVELDAGEVLIGGVPVTATPPHLLRRHIGYVIQSVGLFPHMTVGRNIATVPRMLGWDRRRTDLRVAELLELVGLDPASYASKLPSQLSGGEAQRVGVARALAADPPVLLMDEPFGALDPINRERLQREFAAVHQRLGKTVVFVTHDIEEAVLLGDRIVLMRDGRLVQAGTPEALWRTPESAFVRDFFGDEFGVRILSRHLVSEVPLEPSGSAAATVRPGANLRDALSIMVGAATDRLSVTEDGRSLGTLTFTAVVARVRGLS